MIAEAFPLSMDMPEYVCKKLVHAVKLKAVEIREDCGVLTPARTLIFPFKVPLEYMRKYSPHPGGYFVVYRDNDMSFCPAEVFEETFTLVSEPGLPKQLELELVPKETTPAPHVAPIGYTVSCSNLQGAIEPPRGSE